MTLKGFPNELIGILVTGQTWSGHHSRDCKPEDTLTYSGIVGLT